MLPSKFTQWAVIVCLALMGVTLVGGTAAPPALAQGGPPARLTTLDVALWPEYDKPEVLVIYSGDLPPDTPLPARLTFRIPKSAGDASSAAGVDSGGQYRYQRWETVDKGDYLEISYNCPSLRFQFEYYYDPLTRDGTKRSFHYTFRADYPIDILTMQVQQPYGATNVVLSPPADHSASNNDGLTYHHRSIGAVEQGQTVEWEISYDRTDDRLTIEALGLPGAGTVEFEDTQSTANNRAVALIIGGVVIIAGLGVYWYVTSRSRPAYQRRAQRPQTTRQRPPRRSKKKRRPARAEGSDEPAGGFCHQCGKQLRRDDIFCPRCGTKAKRRR